MQKKTKSGHLSYDNLITENFDLWITTENYEQIGFPNKVSWIFQRGYPNRSCEQNIKAEYEIYSNTRKIHHDYLSCIKTKNYDTNKQGWITHNFFSIQRSLGLIVNVLCINNFSTNLFATGPN